jgi:hypothetical protein
MVWVPQHHKIFPPPLYRLICCALARMALGSNPALKGFMLLLAVLNMLQIVIIITILFLFGMEKELIN